MLIIGLLIATLLPLIFLYVVYMLDLYATSTFRSVLLCFAWGVVSVFLARFGNASLDNLELLDRDVLVRFGAPVVEETLKALVLIYLVRRASFTYFVDAAIYGFAVGMGFAIAENYEFLLRAPGLAVPLAIGRVFSTNLVHASASATVGIALGLARFQPTLHRKVLYAGAGLLAAMTLHSGFNNLVTRLENEAFVLFASSIVIAFGGAAVIVVAIRRGLAEQRAWIEEMLGMADRVTAGEAAAVHRLAEAATILAPLTEQFGQEKATQVGRFLVLQAQLGIQHKLLHKIHDEQQRQATQDEIIRLRQEMNAARQAVGAYVMLGLRNIFPETGGSIWQRLETVIEKNDGGEFFSPTDLLSDLPPVHRKVMGLMMRRREAMTATEVYEALGTQSGPGSPQDVEIDEALEALARQRWLTKFGQETISYKANLGRRAFRNAGWGIWGVLEELAATSDASDAPEDNLWGVLKDKVADQATLSAGNEDTAFWSLLEQRMVAGSTN